LYVEWGSKVREAAMAHPNEELLRQGFEAFSKGDMEAVAALFADDVVFHFPGRGPLAGDHRGRDQVLAVIAKQSELTAGTFRLELHDLLANDEHAVALTVARAERGDSTWEDNAVLVFHIQNGKVSEFWLHPGDQYAGDEFFS
jgi:ketosteroid isomerase-like protein